MESMLVIRFMMAGIQVDIDAIQYCVWGKLYISSMMPNKQTLIFQHHVCVDKNIHTYAVKVAPKLMNHVTIIAAYG